MKRIKPVISNWKYADKADSAERLQAAYSHVFALARRELLEKRRVNHITLWMVTKDTYDTMKQL